MARELSIDEVGDGMTTRHYRGLLLAALILTTLALGGCQGNLDQIVGGVNARATQIAGGDLPTVEGQPTADPNAGNGDQPTPVPPTPEPTQNTFDLTINPNEKLVAAWGHAYGLAPGSQFTIVATQSQVGQYVIDLLKTSGWDATVKGGSAGIGNGQIRLDFAIEDANAKFGSGTATFQPTVDATGLVRLNPQGANFGGFELPDGFTAAIGDATHAALTGAQNNDLAQVTLTQVSLDNGQLLVSGTHK